jgi:heme-degrading monooxygenase HmoA
MPIIIRQHHTVPTPRLVEYEQHFSRYSDAIRAAAGFSGGLLYQSLSYPAHFIRTAVWTSFDDAQAWVRTEPARAFMTANPLEGLATLTQPTEAWDLIIDVQGDTSRTGSIMVLFNWTLDQGNDQAFEQSRSELFELQRDEPTFIVSRLLRLLGTPGRYQAVHVRTEIPTVTNAARAFIAAHPSAEYTSHPPVGETYRIVQTAPPPA